MRDDQRPPAQEGQDPVGQVDIEASVTVFEPQGRGGGPYSSPADPTAADGPADDPDAASVEPNGRGGGPYDPPAHKPHGRGGGPYDPPAEVEPRGRGGGPYDTPRDPEKAADLG